MHTAYHFGNILGPNSYLHKILITVNKITNSINILLPIPLPATTQAATITHGDAKLHVNYSELLMYMIQIIIIMFVFSTIVWTCVLIWNCINTRNFGKLQEKLNFMQFIYADKTELYFQFISNYLTWSIYLGSVHDVTLCEGCVFDFLTIEWENVNLSQNDLDLRFPSSLPVPLTSNFISRKMFRKPNSNNNYCLRSSKW